MNSDDIFASCEAEIKDAVASTFDLMPQPDPTPPETENSIYNFNELLDSV
jgi:hypothetical protein